MSDELRRIIAAAVKAARGGPPLGDLPATAHLGEDGLVYIVDDDGQVRSVMSPESFDALDLEFRPRKDGKK